MINHEEIIQASKHLVRIRKVITNSTDPTVNTMQHDVDAVLEWLEKLSKEVGNVPNNIL